MPSSAIEDAESGFSDVTRQEIRKALIQLDGATTKTGKILRVMERLQEEYVIDFQQFSQIPGDLNGLNNPQLPVERREELQKKLTLQQKLQNSASQLLRLRLDSAKKHETTLSELEWTQRKVVIDARKIFMRKQQLAENMAPFKNKRAATMIDELQEWCEKLADVILKNKVQISNENELRGRLPIDLPEGSSEDFPTMEARVDDLMVALIKSTFVIDQQPSQVLKKDCKFSATLRLLVGAKLNLQYDPPKVKAIIISEKQASDVVSGKEIKAECGDVLNGEGPMEYHAGKLSIHFRSMSLKGFQRPTAHRKVAESVTEEKYCLHFTTVVTLRGQAQKFKIWTMSLPIVVTVHGNQECDAAATVVWDNQFAEPGRAPFNVRDTIPWPDMATMLSVRFYGWTGQRLDARSLTYLANKLFGNEQKRSEVSWQMFNKDTIPGCKFPFWEWFWSVGKLVKECLKGIWIKGLIIGFIDKNESVSQLLSMPVGTFLLRFSDRVLGSVTIACVKDNPDMPGGKEVEHLRPFTSKDFTIRKLADRIHDLPNLRTLYPDRSKDEAFGEFYTSGDEEAPYPLDGYVPVTLKNVIPGEQTGSAMDTSNPSTPMPDSETPAASALNSYNQPPTSPQDYNQPSPMFNPNVSSPSALNSYTQAFPQQDYVQAFTSQGISQSSTSALGFYCPPTPQGFTQEAHAQHAPMVLYDHQQNGTNYDLGDDYLSALIEQYGVHMDFEGDLNNVDGLDSDNLDLS